MSWYTLHYPRDKNVLFVTGRVLLFIYNYGLQRSLKNIKYLAVHLRRIRRQYSLHI